MDESQKKPESKATIGKNPDLLTLSKEDRAFLHDLANPLAIAGGLLEAIREEADRENLKLTEGQIRKLNKLGNALDRIGDLIDSRRKRIVEIQDKLAANGES